MEYAELSDSALAKVRIAPNPKADMARIREIKEQAALLITLIEREMSEKPAAAREGAIAITHIQTAVFFAVFNASAVKD
jgi:hypothetical protein